MNPNITICTCPFCNYHRQFDQTPTPLPDGVPTGSVWSDKEQRWVHPDTQGKEQDNVELAETS
jgi:hypothetical protein